MNIETKEKKHSLTDDTAFKFVLSHDYITKYIVNLFLDYIKSDLKFEVITITPQNYIIGENRTVTSYFGDINCNLSNGDILSIEVYKKNFTLSNFIKSCTYSCKDYSQIRQKKFLKIKLIILNYIK